MAEQIFENCLGLDPREEIGSRIRRMRRVFTEEISRENGEHPSYPPNPRRYLLQMQTWDATSGSNH